MRPGRSRIPVSAVGVKGPGSRSARGLLAGAPAGLTLRHSLWTPFWAVRSLSGPWQTWLSGWSRPSCECCFGGWCRRRRSTVRRAAADVGRVTGRRWPDHLRSHFRLHQAATTAGLRPCLAHRSTDALRNGAGSGSGPDCTASSSTSPAPRATWTGRGARSTLSAWERQTGATDRTDSDRPWQERIEIHLITDRNGLPLSLGISAANTHDNLGLKPLVRGIPAPSADHADDGRRRCTPTRDTTTATCAHGSISAAFVTASQGRRVLDTARPVPLGGRAHGVLAGRVPPLTAPLRA